MSAPSDANLLEAWRGGDDRAGELLFNRHGAAIARFFENKVRVGAEDLVQATFLAMIEKREVVTIDFRAYMFAIARNVLRSHVRRLARDRGVDPDVSSMAAMDPGPSTLAGQRREHRLLLEGLRHLPLDSQILLELHYWEGLDAGTIAKITGGQASSTRQRLTRARRKLDEVMAQLAATPELLATTLQDLEGWAAQIRGMLGGEKGGSAPDSGGGGSA